MAPSVLVERKGLPLNVVAAIGKAQFRTALHTYGLRPKALLVNPKEAPAEAQVGGLKVYTDRDVPLHHVRICAWYSPEKVAIRV